MRLTAFVLVLFLTSGMCVLNAEEEKISYNKDIRPLLSDRCFACHGPDETKRQAELRLDIDSGDQGPFLARSGLPALQPGDPETSELWKRLTTDDPSLHMPPRTQGKNRLPMLKNNWSGNGSNKGPPTNDSGPWNRCVPKACPTFKTKRGPQAGSIDSSWPTSNGKTSSPSPRPTSEP